MSCYFYFGFNSAPSVFTQNHSSCSILSTLSAIYFHVSAAAHERESTIENIQIVGKDVTITKDPKVLNGHEAAGLCKESLATTGVNDSRDSLSSTRTSLDNNEDCNNKSDNSQMDTREMNTPQV